MQNYTSLQETIRLTVTQDVFKYRKNRGLRWYSLRLTVTQDVFKYKLKELGHTVIEGLTVTQDVFKLLNLLHIKEI